MAAPQWEPFEGFSTLQQEMHRLLESFFGGNPGPFEAPRTGPAVEMIDTPEAVVIKAQVPGMRKEQLQVTFSEGSLTIQGERRADEDVAEKSYMRREFRYGPFSRTISLPAALQVDKATAQLRDGLLQITIPKSEATRVTNIPIDG